MSETTKPEKMKLTGKQWGILVALIMMYFFAPTFGAVSSTLSLMPDYFGIPASVVGYISVISSPASCIAGLLVGAFAGRKLSYKATSIIAMTLFVVFGSLPFFWQDITFPVLLVSRFIFGLGVGCINPLVISIVSHIFRKSETARSAWIGIINVVFSIGATTGSMITGVLALNSWQTAYAFYLFAVLPLILVILFFKDSEIDPGSTAEKDAVAVPREKRRIPGGAWIYIIIFMFCTIVAQVFFSYAGVAMGMTGIDTALIGTVFSVFTVAGIAIAAANAGLWKIFRLYNLPLSYALLGFGYIFCIIGFNTANIMWFFVAAVIIGFGCCLAGMVLPMIMSVMVPAASLTLAISMQEVARNLGSFLSSPWLQAIGGIFGDEPVQQFAAIGILAGIVAVVALVMAIKDNKKFKAVEMEKK